MLTTRLREQRIFMGQVEDKYDRLTADGGAASSEANRRTLARPDADRNGTATGRDPSSKRADRHAPHWFAVGAVVTTAIGVAIYSLTEVRAMKRQTEATLTALRLEVHRLDSGIDYDSRRRHLLLGIRDEIMRTNPDVSLRHAYQYAQLLVTASEKYPSVDPLLFLAIGIVESGYDLMATSEAEAKGLYQIWPTTGRLLARALEWDYEDEMLYDPKINTEMAALYLDILCSTYNDTKMVLAEYNGGPINAGYLRAGSSRAANETRDYVEKVTATHQRLKSKLGRRVEHTPSYLHRDVSRRGKRLLRVPDSRPTIPTDE